MSADPPLTVEAMQAQLRDLGLSEEDIKDLTEAAAPTTVTSTAQASESDSDSDDLSSNVKFLQQCFPNIPRGTLRVRLMEHNNDLDKTSEVLLNYDALKDETPQYLDKRYRQFAKRQRKRNQQSRKETDKSRHNTEMLVKVLDIPHEQARQLLEDNDLSFSQATMAFYSRGNFHHVQDLLQELYPENASGKLGVSEKYSNADIDRLFASQSINQRSIARVRDQYELRYATQLERIQHHRGSKLSKVVATDASKEAAETRAKLLELDVLSYRVAAMSNRSWTVDFHMMPVSAALAVCEDKVEEWQRSGTSLPLVLITGAGQHSKDGIPKVKNAIRKYLQGERLKFQEDTGALTLYH